MYCTPLVEAMLEGIQKRLGRLLDDRDCQLAAGFHLKFRLAWLQTYNDILVPRERTAMEEVVEEVVEDAMRQAAEAPSPNNTSEEEEVDDYLTTINPNMGSNRDRNYKTRAHRLIVGWLENSCRLV